MPKKIMRSPIAGFGSKYNACTQIGLHRYIPFLSSKTIYVEPFVCSGVVMFNTNAKMAVINDKSSLIWSFWKALKDHYEELTKELDTVWLGADWFVEYSKREDVVGKAIYFYIINKSRYGGIPIEHFNYKYHLPEFTKDFTEWKDFLNKMKSFTIWNLDFREVYRRLADKGGGSYDFFFYVDPPYVGEGYNYQIEFTMDDHEALAQCNDALKDNAKVSILLSYDDHEWVRNRYKDWYVKKVSWSTVASARKAKDYTELLISNRPIIKRRSNQSANVDNFLKIGNPSAAH